MTSNAKATLSYTASAGSNRKSLEDAADHLIAARYVATAEFVDMKLRD